MDRISDLPDDLLRGILLHLHSTPAAARTSALSRRWRRVWASLPDLVLSNDVIHHRASFLDTVDDALAAYTAGPAVHLRSLVIVVPDEYHNVPAGRVTAWLLFASRRLAGELHLYVPSFDPLSADEPPQGEIELPPFERPTHMTFVLGNRFIRPPPAGLFEALSDLDIGLATMDARALEVLVSTQCPRLENLSLTLVNVSDLSISSASLRRLVFSGWNTGRLNVAAPNLQELRVVYVADISVAAPNLAELVFGSIGQLVFADAAHHLRLLEGLDWSGMAPSSLLRQLETVDELRLHAPGKEVEFQRFMRGTNYLPMCETLSVSFMFNAHDPVPTVLHLLSRGCRIKKLVVLLKYRMAFHRCSLDCPCRSSPESAMAHGISLDSLEEIEFRLIETGDEYIEVLDQLLSISSLK